MANIPIPASSITLGGIRSALGSSKLRVEPIVDVGRICRPYVHYVGSFTDADVAAGVMLTSDVPSGGMWQWCVRSITLGIGTPQHASANHVTLTWHVSAGGIVVATGELGFKAAASGGPTADHFALPVPIWTPPVNSGAVLVVVDNVVKSGAAAAEFVGALYCEAWPVDFRPAV